jgi:hypothetical protein
MKKKCYSKEVEYVVPRLYCSFCKREIKRGEKLCSVVITWGDGRSACEECYNEYEIDWSIHDHDEEIDEDEYIKTYYFR